MSGVDRSVERSRITHDGELDSSAVYDRSFNEQDLEDSLELFDFTYPLPEKQEGILRVFYNNCNGLEINRTIGEFIKQKKEKKQYNYLKDTEVPTKVDGIVRQMKMWEVDLVSLAELCVAWEDSAPRRVIQQITTQYDRTACWTVSSSKLRVGSFLKPGGTGTLTMGECNGRVIDRGADPLKMGRWSYCLITGGSRRSSILVVTGYRPGKRSGQAGPKTAWSQQQALLIKEKRNEDPHSAFLTDLTKWITDYRTPAMELLLCLDANEQWVENAEIVTFANDLKLRNVNREMSLKHTHRNISNVSRSTDIDFCLCSDRIFSNISYASTVPYDLDKLGNHQGVLIDINIANLLREEKAQLEASGRKLVMANPKAVDKYLKAVEEKFDKQNIFKRTRTLLTRVIQGHTDNEGIMKQYEAIDREVYGICQSAEQQCKSAYAGRYEWSPTLDTAIKTVSYWRHRLKRNEETIVIRQLGKLLNIPYVSLSKCTIHQMINDSKVRLIEVRQKSREHRQNHLEALAEQYAHQNSTSRQRAIVELIAHEEARGMFRSLRQSLKPTQYSSLSTLWTAIDENGDYVKDHEVKAIHSDQQTIHQILLDRNARHLRQAADTPFAKGRLKAKLGWDGTGPLSDSMLTGQILNEQRFTREMQLYLESLKVNDLTRLNTVRPNLLLEEYYTFWKKKRENTVTSPFGLHVGHYKAAKQMLGSKSLWVGK